MTKKLLIAAVALLTAAPLALADVGCTVGGTPVAQVIMVGSSAQFNATAYAVQNIVGAANFNLFSVKGKDTAGNGLANVVDSRYTINAANPVDGATLWVAWDGGAPCKFWAYFSTDSTVGVKDFFAYKKNGTKSVAAAFGSLSTLEDGSAGNTWCGASCSRNKVFGLADNSTFNGGDNLPTSILQVLNTPPDGSSVPKQCTGTTYCYFNAAGTDIRPEDALYATSRALSTYDTKSLNGLGYNASNCGGDGLAASKIGCPIYTSVGTGSKFYVSTFKLSGTDPISSGTVPTSTTLSVGYSPIVVVVNNQDTAGFGRKSGGNYVFTNINREVLSQVFQGNLQNTDDLLSTAATAGASAGPNLQVVQREPLSGTYNTFEFTGVRTLTGSGRTLAAKVAGTNVTSNAWSGQEVGNNPGLVNFGTDSVNCPTSGFPTGTVQCNDPLFLGSTGTGFKRIRAIGTGEEVPAAMNIQSGQAASASQAPDGIGYAFWSFGNLKPASAGVGHYLTVDGVDPLFGSPTDGTNAAGAYNIPTCAAVPCTQVIPFTHVSDGTYPLWSLLRAVTLKTTPAAVTTLINTEITLSNSNGLDDYQPLLDGSGNLGTFVFRSHFKPTGSTVAPLNGHKTCTSFSPPTPATCLVDAGGDVGGAVFTVQADVSFFLNTGMELLGVNQ